MRDFKTLKVWLKAHRFSLHVYQYLACLIDEVKRMLISLIGKIAKNQSCKP